MSGILHSMHAGVSGTEISQETRYSSIPQRASIPATTSSASALNNSQSLQQAMPPHCTEALAEVRRLILENESRCTWKEPSSLPMSAVEGEGAGIPSKLGLRLKDGRWLAYEAYGHAYGTPVLYLHGMLGSRLETNFATTATAEQLPVLVITIDRPGYGLSTYQCKRKYSHFASDVEQLLDHLGFETIRVVGFSSGGPHALALAARLSARVAGVACVSSDPPYASLPQTLVSSLSHDAKALWQLFKMAKPLVKPALKASLKVGFSSPAKYIDAQLGPGPGEGRLRSQAGVLAGWTMSFREGQRQGFKAAAQEVRIERRQWGFTLEECKGIPVQVWRGKEDKNIQTWMAEYIATGTGGTLFELEGEGHTSTWVNHWHSILSCLIGLQDPAKMKDQQLNPTTSIQAAVPLQGNPLDILDEAQAKKNHPSVTEQKQADGTNAPRDDALAPYDVSKVDMLDQAVLL